MHEGTEISFGSMFPNPRLLPHSQSRHWAGMKANNTQIFVFIRS